MTFATRLLRHTAVAGAALLLTASIARAQYFNFTVTLDLPAGVNTQDLFLPFPNTPSTTFYHFMPGSNSSGLGAFIPGTNITPYNIVPNVPGAGSPTIPLNSNAPFTVHLTITPSDSVGNPLAVGQTKDFTGTFLSGSTFLGASQANIDYSGWDKIVQTQTYNFFGVPGFGNETFIINPTSITPADPPFGAGGTLGAMSLFVTGNLSSVPEPGTLSLLLGSGVGGSLLMLRRRRHA